MSDERKVDVSAHAAAGPVSDADVDEFEKAMLELAAEEIPAMPAAASTPSICSEQISVPNRCSQNDASQNDYDVIAKRREEWLARLRDVAKQNNQVNWLLGDALNDGEALYADYLTEAEKVTGFVRTHLRDIASTARRCTAEVRRDDLSWTHHRNLVNALPDADADTLRKWLARAVANGWSADAFKEEVRKGASLEEKRFETIEVRLPADVYKHMTYLENGNVEEIAAKWLIERVAAIQQAYDDEVAKQRAAAQEKYKVEHQQMTDENRLRLPTKVR